MDKFVIKGGNRLEGEVSISGAKNAALVIIPAAILSDGVCRIENIPNITDVSSIIHILQDMGAKVRTVGRSAIEIDPSTVSTCVAPYELARHIRGSYYLLGALLGRFHHAVVTMPGGCNFGVRPIDQHLKGFAALGATYSLEGGMVALQILVCKASRGRRQLFRSAPLHRWLELRGQSAEQIFYTFCVIAMLGVALTVQLAKIS